MQEKLPFSPLDLSLFQVIFGLGPIPALGILGTVIGGVVLYFGSPWYANWFKEDYKAREKIIIALRIDAFAQIPLATSLMSILINLTI